MSSWSWRSIKLLLLHLVGFYITLPTLLMHGRTEIKLLNSVVSDFEASFKFFFHLFKMKNLSTGERVRTTSFEEETSTMMAYSFRGNITWYWDEYKSVPTNITKAVDTRHRCYPILSKSHHKTASFESIPIYGYAKNQEEKYVARVQFRNWFYEAAFSG